MLAAVDYISREAAQAEREFAREIEERAGGGQDKADDQDSAAEFAEGVHDGEFRRRKPGSKEVMK